MDIIVEIPGLQHIAEDIFLELEEKSLKKCQNLNRKYRNFLGSPRFLLKFWLNKLSQEELFQDDIESYNELVKKLVDVQLQESMVNQLKKLWKFATKNCTKWNLQYFSGSPLNLAVFLIKAKQDPELVQFILENIDPMESIEL